MARRIFIGIVALACMGCPLSDPGRGKVPPTKSTPKASASIKPGEGATLALQTLPVTDPTRLIDLGAPSAQIVGKVKLISDHGVGIISNNSGGLISDHGVGIISNNSAGIISNNAGGIVGKTKYGVLAEGDAAPAEASLAEAQIEILDGAGNVLTTADGAPVVTHTDQQGNYKFEAPLPDETLIMRVRLFPNGGSSGAGGQLLAILPRAATKGAAREIDLDTASSLGASYVLDRYVKKRQAIFNRLPAEEAVALKRDLDTARVGLPSTPPTYKASDLVAATEELRGKAPLLDGTLERIKAILLAGQSDLGQGLLATHVSLAGASAVLSNADGSFLVAEGWGSRIRLVGTDGKMGLFFGGGKVRTAAGLVDQRGDQIETPTAMVRLADGSLVICDGIAQRIRKISPDGVVSTILGTGRRTQDPMGRAPELTSILGPHGLALGPDGSIYVGEITKGHGVGRILRLAPGGILTEIPPPPTLWERAEVSPLAVAPDGTLYVVNERAKCLQRRSPAGVWTVMAENLGVNDYSQLLVLPDGGLLLAEEKNHRIKRFEIDGRVSIVAGTGEAGDTGDGGPARSAKLNRPSGLGVGPDGRVLIIDSGNGLVRAIAVDGTIQTIAGTRAVTQNGDATSIAINSPAGLAIDPQGRIVVAEASGHTIKRLDGQLLTVLAGSTQGLSGDGGPATSAQFDGPASLAYRGNSLFVIDSSNACLRRIDENGIITTVVGSLTGHSPSVRKTPALQTVMERALGMAISPDGVVYWVDNQENQVLRLLPDNMVEIVVGDLKGGEGDEGDGGPAALAKLSKPVGVAFDAKGDLYVADSGNLRIRKVTGLSGNNPTITAFAGINKFAAIAKLLGGALPNEEGVDAAGALLIGPTVMCFDKAGALYVAEAGTGKLSTLGSSFAAALGTMPRLGSRIRKITPDGKIRSIAGEGTALLADPTSDNSLVTPLGLVIDQQGRLIIADSGNNQIKLLPAGSF